MKGLLILQNGFEDCEALATRALLKNNGFDITTITFNNSLDVVSASNLMVKADLSQNVISHEYDFLIIPGGPYVKNVIEKEHDLLLNILSLINNFANDNKFIGAICAAPAFLGKLNLLKNHSFTCFPGYESYIKEGEYCVDKMTVLSGQFVTSQSPWTVLDFANVLLNIFNKQK
ncbi:DJ-1/PfpI family protein [Candidatus Phytoplasma fabacearum]|uniref:DJ-1/PfpI family protein n=1 Tax=Candidatus Phytoplasma fabacearum TaxID=2982628 RepID=UPI0027138870|nr:DJ-1/PfpI family protein ['Bituminaria bituminosa' little leaf phytoplasma]MDO8024131.1 DJ-1/PfpI family protein ['Bituminaria bituminosa' little leaf phytoplasma]MDV3158233.1 DJ-1/PfpI family protein [Pigeon pea little leaf phytoplasma]